jgi:putative spermidine/putrescine transport system ATP-binding protein
MARLQLLQLRKRFGETEALKGIDLDVASGEFVSLLGPSGCGKTTALRIVAGFDFPTGGQILVDDKDIIGTPANRRDMGMVFQSYSLFPNMSALDNVAFGLKVRRVGRSRRRARAAELLELVGLGERLNSFPHQLSGGQQQRVALARALAIEPSVLLLDEPLSALDAKVRLQLREEIRRIQLQLGITALYVTHDQEEALSISDRVVVLSQGQIEQVGVPAEIYGNPATLFVAEFIGTMNRVRGSVAPGGAGLVDADGAMLPVEEAARLPAGRRVVVLIRPESIELETQGTDVAPQRPLAGRVTAHTFLGAVTRLSIQTTPVASIFADIPTTRALALSIGTAVTLGWDPAAPRLINLADDESSTIEELAASYSA